MATTNSAKRYPTKADITRALDAARRLNLKIDGFEVGPRGVIRVQAVTNRYARLLDRQRIPNHAPSSLSAD